MKKRCLCLLLVLVAIFSISASSLTVVAASNYNPTFSKMELYATGPNGLKTLVHTKTWSGAVQPGLVEIPIAKYRELSGQGYNGWIIRYTINSRDCVWMKLYSTNDGTYFNKTLEINKTYYIECVVPGYISERMVYADYTVDGITMRNREIGGFIFK